MRRRSSRANSGHIAKSSIEGLDEREERRVDRDRQQRPRHDELEARLGQQPDGEAERAEDERELADLPERGGDRQGDPRGIAERLDDAECRKRLDEDDQDQHRHDGEWIREEHSRVEEHPDRHEEQHGEGVTQWKGVGGRLMTHVRLAHDETCQECAEREGHTEDRRRGVGDPERDRKDRQREQLP